MLRIIQPGTGRPISYPVNPNSVFQPGMFAQLQMLGNDVIMGVSDGLAPFGIIDDVKDTSFTTPQIDEVVIIKPATITTDGYGYFSGALANEALQNADIVESSFTSDVPGLTLNSINGMLTAPVGTQLNYTTPDSSTPNAVRAIIRYTYRVSNMPGEDTTLGSGRVTLWFTRGIFQTDQFETTSPFYVNANLYVSENGKLTTTQSLPNQQGVAIVVVPPSASSNWLEFLYF